VEGKEGDVFGVTERRITVSPSFKVEEITPVNLPSLILVVTGTLEILVPDKR
jgi:hypothetical protein